MVLLLLLKIYHKMGRVATRLFEHLRQKIPNYPF